MAKKIKSPPPAPVVAPPGVKSTKKVKGRRGRKKERTQISVRIDAALMALAYRDIEGTSMRITDLLERGLLLALRELSDIDPLFHQARLILHDEGVEFSRLIIKINAWSRFPEVRPLTAAEGILREHILNGADAVMEMPRVDEVIHLMGSPKKTGKPTTTPASAAHDDLLPGKFLPKRA